MYNKVTYPNFDESTTGTIHGLKSGELFRFKDVESSQVYMKGLIMEERENGSSSYIYLRTGQIRSCWEYREVTRVSEAMITSLNLKRIEKIENLEVGSLFKFPESHHTYMVGPQMGDDIKNNIHYFHLQTGKIYFCYETTQVIKISEVTITCP